MLFFWTHSSSYEGFFKRSNKGSVFRGHGKKEDKGDTEEEEEEREAGEGMEGEQRKSGDARGEPPGKSGRELPRYINFALSCSALVVEGKRGGGREDEEGGW